MDAETPKKHVKYGPKPQNVNDFCRVCKKNLKVHCGGASVSTENLFKASERKECRGLVLATACEGIGLRFTNSSSFSQRILQNYTLIRECLLNQDQEDSSQANSTPRQKRCIPTTVTPDRRSPKKKLIFEKSKTCATALTYENRSEEQQLNSEKEIGKQPPTSLTMGDLMENNLNVATMLPTIEKNSEVRVLIGYPSGDVVVKQKFDTV